MKKYSTIGYGAILVFAFVLAGCGSQKAANTNAPGKNSSAGDSNQSLADTVKQGLYDMVTSGAGVKCTIQDPKMGELTMYAKGDKAKMEGYPYVSMATAFSGSENGQPPVQEEGTMVNDGTWVYMWGSKDGMKFNIKEMQQATAQNTNQNQNQNQQASDWKDWVKKMDTDGTKYDCSPAVLSDADFTPPSNIQFEDWGEMMKGFQKMGEDMKNRVPGQGPPAAVPPVLPTP